MSLRQFIGVILDIIVDQLDKLFMKFRWFMRKKIINKLTCIDSTCSVCGRKHHDFIVLDDEWKEIIGEENKNIVLCYDCFCELQNKKGIYKVWLLKDYDKEYPLLQKIRNKEDDKL